jgi:hypothetical protein
MNNSNIVISGRNDGLVNELELDSYNQTQSIFINSKDRNIDQETTFNFNINFGNSSYQGGCIIKVFRNIKELKVNDVIMPDMYIQLKDIHSHVNNGNIVLENNSNINKSHIIPYKKLSDCEYITMRIREFTQTNYGTNNYLNESFCVLKNDNDRCKNASNIYNYDVSTGASPTLMTKDNFGSLLLPSLRDKMNHFVNISQSKHYYTSTKGVLNNLEISFHLPNGKEIEMLNDSLTISSVYLYDGSVRVATTAALSVTKAGDVLTATANGAIQVDGVTLDAGDYLVVKDQSDLTENGFYEVTTVGNGGAPFVLTRISTNTYTTNSTVYITEGTNNIGHIYRNVSTNLVFRRENSLKIKTTRYFSSEEYKVGNSIKITNLTTSGANTNNELNSFLEREEGHIILNVFDSENSSNTLFNTIVIGLKYDYKNSNGSFTYNDFSLSNNLYSFTAYNKLINIDMQNLINMDYN